MHVLVIRNLEDDQQELGEGQRGKEEKLGRLHEEWVQVLLDFDYISDFRTSIH